MLLCTLQSSLLFQQLPSPVSYASAPVAVVALVAAPVTGPVLSQFQAQDEFGNLAYEHQNINSAKQEHGNTYGEVTGSYTYADEPESTLSTMLLMIFDSELLWTIYQLPQITQPHLLTPLRLLRPAAFFAAFET